MEGLVPDSLIFSHGHNMLQVQGLGDVLEIEENLASGDDGVKIQD